jgi:hypothetical protein
MFADAPVFRMRPPAGFEVLTTAIAERCAVTIVYEHGSQRTVPRRITPRPVLERRSAWNSCLIGTARGVQEGKPYRAEVRQERNAGHDSSSQGPTLVSRSDTSACASAHTTLGARYSADTALKPTSTLLTTLFITSRIVVSLDSMATGLHPEIRASHAGLATREHRGTVPGR